MAEIGAGRKRLEQRGDCVGVRISALDSQIPIKNKTEFQTLIQPYCDLQLLHVPALSSRLLLVAA